MGCGANIGKHWEALESIALFYNIVLMDNSIHFCIAVWLTQDKIQPQVEVISPPSLHMLLWEPFHKLQEEGTRMYLDLCKPSTSQKGHRAHALCVRVSTRISTYRGQDLPIQGGESIKVKITEHPLFLYFLAVISILK